MKRITTSAQKTVELTKDRALTRLRHDLAEQESVQFRATGNPDIYAADFTDGSTLHVAAFAKDEGRSLAMIDHRNVREGDRSRWQRHWRKTIDQIFDPG